MTEAKATNQKRNTQPKAIHHKKTNKLKETLKTPENKNPPKSKAQTKNLKSKPWTNINSQEENHVYTALKKPKTSTTPNKNTKLFYFGKKENYVIQQKGSY